MLPFHPPPSDDAIEAIIQQATRDSRPPQPDTRTQLFVGNLPYRVRWQDLKDLFRQAGTVLRADVSLGPDNRSRGYGTVLLASAEDAARAVQLFNGYNWQTRILEVRPDRLVPDQDLLLGHTDYDHPLPLSVPPGHDLAACRTLFVGNLPFHCQWQDLKDLFRQAGTILRADVALGPDGRSRGFGSVVFATEHDADRAVRMLNGYEYSGRTLKVHFDKFSSTPQSPTPLHSIAAATTNSARDPSASSTAFSLDYSSPPRAPSPSEIFSRLQQQRSTPIYQPTPHSQARQAHHLSSSRSSTAAQSSVSLDPDSLAASLASTRILGSLQSSASGSSTTTTSSSSERSYSSTSASSVSQPKSSHSRPALFSHQQQRHEQTPSFSSTSSSTSLSYHQQPHHPGPIALPPPPQLAFHPQSRHPYHVQQSAHSALPISPLQHPAASAGNQPGSPYHPFSAATPMVPHPTSQYQHQGAAFVVTPQGAVPLGPAPITPSMPPFTFVGHLQHGQGQSPAHAQRDEPSSSASPSTSSTGSIAAGQRSNVNVLSHLHLQHHQSQGSPRFQARQYQRQDNRESTQHSRSASRSTTSSSASGSGSLKSETGKSPLVSRTGSSLSQSGRKVKGTSASVVSPMSASTATATAGGDADSGSHSQKTTTSATRPAFTHPLPLPSPSFVFPGAMAFNPSPLNYPHLQAHAPPITGPLPLPIPLPTPPSHHPNHHLHPLAHHRSPQPPPGAYFVPPPHPHHSQTTTPLHLNLASVHSPFSPAGIGMMSPGTVFGRAGENLIGVQNPMMNPAVGAPIRVGDASSAPPSGSMGVGEGPGRVQQQQQPMGSPLGYPVAAAIPPHLSRGAYMYAVSSPHGQSQQQQQAQYYQQQYFMQQQQQQYAQRPAVQEPQGYFDPAYFPAGTETGSGGGDHGVDESVKGKEIEVNEEGEGRVNKRGQDHDNHDRDGDDHDPDLGNDDESGFVISPTSARVASFGQVQPQGQSEGQTEEPLQFDLELFDPASLGLPTVTRESRGSSMAAAAHKAGSLPLMALAGQQQHPLAPRRQTTMTKTKTDLSGGSSPASGYEHVASLQVQTSSSTPVSASGSTVGSASGSVSGPGSTLGTSTSAPVSGAAMVPRRAPTAWKNPVAVVEIGRQKFMQQQQQERREQ